MLFAAYPALVKCLCFIIKTFIGKHSRGQHLQTHVEKCVIYALPQECQKSREKQNVDL